MAERKKVFICSPFCGDMEGNARKAAIYSRIACDQGYLPIAPHLLFPQFLNEGVGAERQLGISMGLELLLCCDEVWVFGEATAVEGVAADMVISPKVSAMETAQMKVSSMDSIRQMVSGIQEMFAGMQDNDKMGTICIPAYIGGTLLDEVVVNAQARQNLRSGGR